MPYKSCQVVAKKTSCLSREKSCQVAAKVVAKVAGLREQQAGAGHEDEIAEKLAEGDADR